jgi:hypothetical protein
MRSSAVTVSSWIGPRPRLRFWPSARARFTAVSKSSEARVESLLGFHRESLERRGRGQRLRQVVRGYGIGCPIVRARRRDLGNHGVSKQHEVLRRIHLEPEVSEARCGQQRAGDGDPD